MKKFLHYKMILIFVLLIMMTIVSHETSLDRYLVTFFYDPHNGFIYRNNYWLEKVFHKGGVLFVGGIGLIIIARFLYLLIKKREKYQQELLELGFVFISVLTSVCLIKFFKSVTTLPCPWNMEIFGGSRVFQGLSTLFSKNYNIGYCFPSGHASAGYGFLSLYFAKALHKAPSKKYLLPGLLLGGVYGLTQQMRGAHFLSHDLATILICLWIPWTFSFILSLCKQR